MFNNNSNESTEFLENNFSKATLIKHQVLDMQQNMFQNNISESPKLQHPFFSNNCNPSSNTSSHYVDLNSFKNQPNLLIQTGTTTQATTAYLVQTPNGSALIIPPQNIHHVNHHHLQNNGSLTINRNPSEINNLHLHNNTLTNKTTNNLVHSNSKTNFINNPNNMIARSDSTTSTNVYQTIDK